VISTAEEYNQCFACPITSRRDISILWTGGTDNVVDRRPTPERRSCAGRGGLRNCKDEYSFEEQRPTARLVIGFAQALRKRPEGPSHVAKMLILDRGGKFTPMSISSVINEFLASRQSSISAIYRTFGMPEPLIQIGTRVPSDMPQFMWQFETTALARRVALIGSQCDAAVLPIGQQSQIDISGPVRGSSSTAVAALSIGRQSDIFTANPLRAVSRSGAARGRRRTGIPAVTKGLPALHPSSGPGGDLPTVGTNQGPGPPA
jgi:hypothetical protein